MNHRTWPYGTKKKARVVNRVEKGGLGAFILVDDDNEGHVLIGVQHRYYPRAGEQVNMTFVEGGPTGGYWQITEPVQ